MLAVEGRCVKNGRTKGTLVGASCGMLPPLLPFDVRLLHQLNLLGCGNTALAFSLVCLQKVEALVRFTWKKLSKNIYLKIDFYSLLTAIFAIPNPLFWAHCL